MCAGGGMVGVRLVSSLYEVGTL